MTTWNCPNCGKTVEIPEGSDARTVKWGHTIQLYCSPPELDSQMLGDRLERIKRAESHKWSLR
jgi:hypothetical protein